MENIFVEFLPPWVETGIQPAFYDKESGTVLQQTARMYARVNMLIRMFNKLSKNTKTEVERFEEVVDTRVTNFENSVNETVADYIEQFNQLHDYVHDYFDNLDVQEEINNKLDDMVEAGTLQEIITTYIQSNVAWTFDTVADMKVATNLVDGSYAQTLGFYSVNDGGGSLYKITDTGTANEMDVIAVGSLYANLIRPETINPIMLGAKGDGTTDDSLAIQQTILYAKNNSIDAIDGINKTYLVSDIINLPLSMSSVSEKGLYIDYGVIIKNFHFTLKDACAALTSVLNIQIPAGYQTIVDNVEINGNGANQSTEEGMQDGGLHGIRIGKKSDPEGAIIVRNSYIHDCYSDCIVIREATYDYVNVDNCRIIRAGRNGITDNSKSSLIENTIFTDNGYRTAPKSGYHVEADESFDFGTKTLKNCTIDYTGSLEQNRGGLNIYFNQYNYTFKELNIIDCNIDKISINSSNSGTTNTFDKVNIINTNFGGKYQWVGKPEAGSKLEFKTINIDRCTFSRYVVIQGGTSTVKPDLTISNTVFTGNDDTLELYFGFKNVNILGCVFTMDTPKTAEGQTNNCINANFTESDVVYTIDNMLIENCRAKNYRRLFDNHTYSSSRTGKNITSIKFINNTYEMDNGTGVVFMNYGGGTVSSCLISNNIARGTITNTSKKYQTGTCGYVLASNNICEFVTSQGFDVTGATKSIVDNNLFSDS